MILKIRSWCEGIIIAIIISVIIEMLIPEGNNKKYVKVIVGIYIMFVMLNPILELLNYDFDYDFSNIFNFEYEEAYSSLDSEIKDVYIIGIEESIKEEIEELGYIVKRVKVFVDLNYENIEKIELEVEKDMNNIEIETVVIGNGGQDSINENDEYDDILKYLYENYFIEENQVFFY